MACAHEAMLAYYTQSTLPNSPTVAEQRRSDAMSLPNHIMQTQVTTSAGPAFKVLSVRKEYILLSVLGTSRDRQALRQIDGRSHDRLETAKGAFLFDISAFFRAPR